MVQDNICVECRKTGSQCFSRCGHILHKKCFQKLNTRYCPKCQKRFSSSVEVEKFFGNIASLGLDLPEVKELIIFLENFTEIANSKDMDDVVSYTSIILRKLQKYGWDINDEALGGPQLFRQACKHDDRVKVNMLIEHGLDFNKYGSSGLSLCYSSLDTFDRLIKLGIKSDEKLIFNVISGKNINMLQKLILNHGHDVNFEGKEGNRPIHHAAIVGSIKMFEFLVKNGADVTVKDNDGDSIIHYACNYDRNIDIIKYFIDNGFDFDTKNNDGYTPLLIAIRYGCSNIATFLIEKNLSIYICDNFGDAPLHFCAHYKQFHPMKVLIEKKVDINAKNLDGKTALHLTVSKEFDNLINLLLDNGADVNVLDNSGLSPLGCFQKKLETETIQRLIDLGADLNLKHENGKSIRMNLIEKNIKLE